MPRNVCCDPYKVHKTLRTKSLKKAPKNLIEKVCDDRVKDGDYLCIACTIKLNRNPKSLPSPPREDSGSSFTVSAEDECVLAESSTSEPDVNRMKADQVLSILDISPLVSQKGLRTSQQRSSDSEKMKRMSASFRLRMKRAREASVSTPEQSPGKRHKADDEDELARLRKMMLDLKGAYESSTDYRRRLSILTLSPYTLEKTASFFGTSMYMARKARQLREGGAVLPELHKSSKGRRMSDDDKEKVVGFFESDDVSRMLPGKKDYVIVRDKDGGKVKIQKRLVMGGLREIYDLYKKSEDNPEIGFSRFASLRPKHCVLAGSSGTHAVCVCTYHQNPILLVDALGLGDLTVDDLLDHAVCDTANRDCMMQACAHCPGAESVYEFLRLASSDGEGDDDVDDDEVRYKQWVSTDRCQLKDITETRDECLRSLSRQIEGLTVHHYRARAQSGYFSRLKDTVVDGEVVVQGDFAENYSFAVQDEAQGFHWDTSQCTVHPYVAYWRVQGKLHHQSFCCISDATKHDTAMVHAFNNEVISEIRKDIPGLKKVHYFTDGCAAQYKNRKNFVNICHHEDDFGVPCEWNFFATAHGKGACDGIGGTVKRAVYRESLRRPMREQILDAETMFRYLTEQFETRIRFILVSKEKVQQTAVKLHHRFARALLIKGTKGFHRFTPVSQCSIMVRELSADDGGKIKSCCRQ